MVDRSALRFLVAGSATVGIDAIAYALLLEAGLTVDVAKICGFAAGTIFAYFVNRDWTFGADRTGKWQVFRFLAVYLGASGLNVLVNHQGTVLFGTDRQGLMLAWFIATACSSTWNYIGLRYFVFNKSS